MNRKKIITLVLICVAFLLSSQNQYNYLVKAKQFYNIDSSIVYAEKSLAFSNSKKDTNAIIETSRFLAHAYLNKSLYPKAEKILKNALKMALYNKDSKNEALLILELANKCKYEGDFPNALKLYTQSYNLFQKNADWNNFLTCNIDLAEFHRKIGKHDEAKKYINKSFLLYKEKKINSLSQLVRINNRAAAIENESGDSSIYYSLIALSLSRQINDKYSEAVSLNELGYTHKNLRHLDSAINCYKRAEEIWFSIGADREALNAMNNRAMLYSHNNYPPKEVIQFCKNIIAIIKEKGIEFPLSNLYINIHTQYVVLKDNPHAYEYFRKYHAAVFDEANLKRLQELNNIKEKYENDKIKSEIEFVSTQLSESKVIIEQKKRENYFIYSFLLITFLLLILVAYLFFKLNKTNKTLQFQNKEKDVLIQEIHHRVKNNLQFVSSLINMQIKSSTQEADNYSLNDTSRRIKAMSLVHEMLYNQTETSGVFINEYLNELIASINELVNSKNIPIKFTLNVEKLIFDTSKSIALGMITSELISNAIKYAFNGKQQAQIHISLKRNTNNNKIEFSFKDNGVGIEEIKETTNKLGMRLVSIFSRQLKGEFKFVNENGLKFNLEFKYK